MAIYVDNSMIPYRGSRYSHMMTDGNIEELHAFAQRIGLKRAWFQNTGNHPHYDVSVNKRQQAINNGAIACSPIEIFKFCVRKEKPSGASGKVNNQDS